MKTVKPKVRLLAYTQPVDELYNPIDASKIEALVVAFARSTRSTDTIENIYIDSCAEGGIPKYIAQYMKMKHFTVFEFIDFTFEISGISRACYDKETEIYTTEGWKYFYELVGNESVLTFNSEKDQSEFKPIKNITKYEYNGYLHFYKSQNVDLLVTPDHSLFTKKHDVRIPDKYKLNKSNEININKFYMSKLLKYNRELDNEIEIKGYSYHRNTRNINGYLKTLPDIKLNRENFFKLLAWYLSEGSVYYNEKENSYTITISQTDIKKNIENIKEIIEIINNLGFTPTKEKNAVKFKSSQLGKLLKTLGICDTKYIPFDLFTEFNKEYSKIFIDTYCKGDGTNNEGHRYLFTSSKKLADQLQMLVLMSGKTASIWYDYRPGERFIKGMSAIFTKGCYVISISDSKRNSNPLVKKNKHFGLKEYNDMVYCVEAENHIIYVRRNGLTIWCGNCSHELVRHRTATYLQQSQRHVDLRDRGVVVPPSIESDDRSLQSMIASDRLWRATYEYIVDTMKTPKEDARFIAPNSIETRVIMKIDGRNLLHFLKLRTDMSAMWEIREVANMMWEEAKKVCSCIFDIKHMDKWV